MGNHSKIKIFFEQNQAKLVEAYPGVNIKFLIETFDDCLDQVSLSQFFEKLNEGIPLQYISGKAYFYKSSFLVNEDVLIPRSETEILIEKAVEELNKIQSDSPPKILDVGTGSGAIILSIMQDYEGTLEATASDISIEALSVSKRNYFNLEYTIPKESSLEFVCSDRLNKLDEKFHIIVSNPPYIKENIDRDMVHTKVIEYEPHVALFLKDKEYEEWFSYFFKQVFKQLLPMGTFIMEGHENHLVLLKKLALDIGFINVSVIKDYTDRDRFLMAKKE